VGGSSGGGGGKRRGRNRAKAHLDALIDHGGFAGHHDPARHNGPNQGIQGFPAIVHNDPDRQALQAGVIELRFAHRERGTPRHEPPGIRAGKSLPQSWTLLATEP